MVGPWHGFICSILAIVLPDSRREEVALMMAEVLATGPRYASVKAFFESRIQGEVA